MVISVSDAIPEEPGLRTLGGNGLALIVRVSVVAYTSINGTSNVASKALI